MNATERGQYTCAACATLISLTSDRRCENCGVSYASDAARSLQHANDSLSRLRGQAAEITVRIEQWEAYRDTMVTHLRATAPVGWVSRLADVTPAPPTPAAARPAEPAPDAVVDDSPLAQPAPAAPAVAAAAAPASATTSAPTPSVFARPSAPREPGRAAEAARKALTAPALLGIAGASLLIAASIVFVALAWTAFSPVARGAVVSGVALLVSGIAVWLKRMDLSISSGAVGVVAMGFAGTASLAFSRGGDEAGRFETPTAFLIACIAGLVLSRLGIAWTGSAAGLSFAASAVGFTIATTSNVTASDGSGDPGTMRGVWVWAIVGTLSAAVLAATYRFWRFPVAMVAVRWASVVWLAIVGLGAVGWTWLNEAVALDAVFALLPVIALIVVARWWPLLATGPAVFLITLAAPATASILGASAWQQAAAVAVAVAALLAVGPRLPVDTRLPMFIALSPGYLTVAVASAAYSILITVARIIAGTYTPDTEMWAGVAALVAGLSIAQLRLWRLDNPLIRAAQSVGAAMVVTGVGIVAFGVAESANRDYHTFVALTMGVAAAGLLAAVWAWSDKRARWLSANAAVVFALVAAFHGGWGIVESEAHLAVGLAVVALSLVVLAWRAVTSPWWGALPATAVVLVLASAVAARYDLAAPWVLGGAVLVAATIVWSAPRLPVRFHRPTLAGLAPALAVTVASAGAVAIDLLVKAFDEKAKGIDPLWIAVAVVGAVGLAGVRRWPDSARLANATAITGALATVPVAISTAFFAAREVLPEVTGAAALMAVPLSLALAATGWAWRSRHAAWTTGVSATVMLTFAGFNSSLTLARADDSAWLPGLVTVATVGFLGGFAAWWPRVTLAPAALVFTAAIAGLAARVSDEPVTILATTVAGPLALGLALWLRREHSGVAAIGTLPGLTLATLAGGTAAAAGFVEVLSAGGVSLGVVSWPMALASLGVAAHLTLLGRVPGAGRESTWRLGAAVAALASLIVATAAAGHWAVGKGDLLDEPQLRAVSTAVVAVAGATVLALLARWLRRRELADAALARTVEIALVAWLTLVALASTVATARASTEWPFAAASVLLIAVMLAVAARWRASYVAGSISLLAAALPFALLVERVGYAQALLVATAVAAATAWLVIQRWRAVAPQAAVGQSLVYAAAAFVLLQSAVISVARLVDLDAEYAPEEFWVSLPWTVLTVVVIAAGLLALPQIRAWAGTVAIFVVMATVHALVPLAAAAVLAAVGLVAAILGRRARAHDAVAFAATAVAVLWSTQSTAAIAAALAVVGAASIVIARRQSVAGARWAVAVAPFAMGGAAAAAVIAAGGAGILAAPVAMVTIATVAIILARSGLDPRGQYLPWIVATATIVSPLASGGLAAAGVTLVVACAVWVTLTAMGRGEGRWWCAGTISLGVGLIAAEAGLAAIEAYTLVPAACALTLGILWMREDEKVRSIVALWPGLALGLVPSYIALARDADATARTIMLTIAIVVLALLGARLRWFALVLATATTALVVSALQIIVGSNMVLRVISFAVVGSLLLAIASWFERIKTLR